jgi:hypothetical protein
VAAEASIVVVAVDTYEDNVDWTLYRLTSDEVEVGDDLAVASLVTDVDESSPLAIVEFVEKVVTIAMVVGSLIG